MPSFCQNLKTNYERLQVLADAFVVEYALVKDSGDFTQVKILKKELEEARDAFLEPIILFVVPDAHNPYHEGLLAAGVDPKKIKEKAEVTLDIRQEIQQQVDFYGNVKDKDGKPVLQAWIDDITKNEGLIYAEVAKDRLKIIERIKAGMIPVVMPSRQVQMKSWEIAMTQMKPLWVKNGKQEFVKDTFLDNLYKTNGVDYRMNLSGFFQNIPDHPYLVWTKPTQKPDPDTLNKSFEDQQTFYGSLVSKYPDLYDKTDLIPTEFMALQAIFTYRSRDRYKELEGETSDPLEITPLDRDTFTRFLSAGLFSDDSVPGAKFYFSNRDVGIGCEGSERHSRSGFRPAARS